MIKHLAMYAVIGVVLAAPVTIPLTVELAPKTTAPWLVDFAKVNFVLAKDLAGY